MLRLEGFREGREVDVFGVGHITPLQKISLHLQPPFNLSLSNFLLPSCGQPYDRLHYLKNSKRNVLSGEIRIFKTTRSTKEEKEVRKIRMNAVKLFLPFKTRRNQ